MVLLDYCSHLKTSNIVDSFIDLIKPNSVRIKHENLVESYCFFPDRLLSISRASIGKALIDQLVSNIDAYAFALEG